MTDRPNILWVCTEHQRFDTIGALGNPHVRTPNLDRLVAEGTAFTHAFGQNTVCTPSRASFLTGRYPLTTRVRQNGQNIPEHEVLVTRHLADLGYDCGLAGKLHVCAAGEGWEKRIDDGYRMFEWCHGPFEKYGGDWLRWVHAQGKRFDDVYGPNDILLSRQVLDLDLDETTWCFQRAREFIEEERGGPWLMSVNPWDVHDPFTCHTSYLEHFDPDTLPPPIFEPGELDNKPYPQQAAYEKRAGGYANTTVRQRCEMKAAYYACIEHVDHQFGRLLDWLDETGRRENTLVIFQADHGDMLGDHGLFQKGCYLYEPAMRVPLILSWPGRLPQGVRCDALVELVDLVPTIYELLGVERPKRVQGRSLLPVMADQIPPGEHRDSVWSMYYNSNPAWSVPHQDRTYATMYRDHRYKIVVYHGEELGELYDLETDPNELTNLWADPASRVLRDDLTRRCFDRTIYQMDPDPPRVSNF